MDPHGDRKPAIRPMPDLFMWMLPDWLRFYPACVPEELLRQYQDSSAHHRQWSCDAPSFQHGTQSNPIVLEEVETDTAAVQIPTEQLEEAYHQQACVTLPSVEIHAAIDAYAPPSHPQLQHIVVSPSSQLASQQLNDMDVALEQQQQPVLPVFQDDLLSDVEYYYRELINEAAELDYYTPCLLLKKKLTITDTKLSQCRLSVPKSAVRQNFTAPLFWQQEIDKFDNKDGLEVTTFDQNTEKYTMRLKLWKSCGTYVLLGSWRKFLLNNNQQGTEKEISIWGCRHPDTRNIVFFIIPAH